MSHAECTYFLAAYYVHIMPMQDIQYLIGLYTYPSGSIVSQFKKTTQRAKQAANMPL